MTEKVTTLYQAIGGDPVVRALTHRFYELMDTLPEASNVRAVHPPSLTGS
ncbi:MAG: globin, partial [Rhizobium leguminosarum]|nr:globin [Rhizobium leguminosarum]